MGCSLRIISANRGGKKKQNNNNKKLNVAGVSNKYREGEEGTRVRKKMKKKKQIMYVVWCLDKEQRSCWLAAPFFHNFHPHRYCVYE